MPFDPETGYYTAFDPIKVAGHSPRRVGKLYDWMKDYTPFHEPEEEEEEDPFPPDIIGEEAVDDLLKLPPPVLADIEGEEGAKTFGIDEGPEILTGEPFELPEDPALVEQPEWYEGFGPIAVPEHIKKRPDWYAMIPGAAAVARRPGSTSDRDVDINIPIPEPDEQEPDNPPTTPLPPYGEEDDETTGEGEPQEEEPDGTLPPHVGEGGPIDDIDEDYPEVSWPTPPEEDDEPLPPPEGGHQGEDIPVEEEPDEIDVEVPSSLPDELENLPAPHYDPRWGGAPQPGVGDIIGDIGGAVGGGGSGSQFTGGGGGSGFVPGQIGSWFEDQPILDFLGAVPGASLIFDLANLGNRQTSGDRANIGYARFEALAPYFWENIIGRDPEHFASANEWYGTSRDDLAFMNDYLTDRGALGERGNYWADKTPREILQDMLTAYQGWEGATGGAGGTEFDPVNQALAQVRDRYGYTPPESAISSAYHNLYGESANDYLARFMRTYSQPIGRGRPV